MSNNTNCCHYMLIVLGLMTIGLSFILGAFTLVLTNDNNHMLMDATITTSGTMNRAFRVASCDVGTCQEERTFWKTVVMPASTVTETATVYVSNHDGSTPPATTEIDIQSTTLMPYILPTENVEEPEEKGFSVRGTRSGHIVDVNKPEMQM